MVVDVIAEAVTEHIPERHRLRRSGLLDRT
jgi:hypothetical protein